MMIEPLRSFRLRLASAILISAAPSAVHAKGLESSEAMRQISPDSIRAHMTFLADDLLEGRGTGSRGYEIAAHYVATQFATVGLEPAGESGGYFQSVPFRRADLIESAASAVI